MVGSSCRPHSLIDLDPKHRVTLIPQHGLSSDTPAGDAAAAAATPLSDPSRWESAGLDGVWIIENFLSESQCNAIITTAESSGLATEVAPGHSRLLAFDEELLALLERRLETSGFWGGLVDGRWRPPSTFVPTDFAPPVTPRCNPCLRVHRFAPDSDGFHLHRDAPYVESAVVRSNYTLIVYLCGGGAEAGTRFASTSGPYDGRRLAEENVTGRGTVTCVKGRAVVFDQRIPHAGIVGDSVKVSPWLLCGFENVAMNGHRFTPDCPRQPARAQRSSISLAAPVLAAHACFADSVCRP